MPREKEGSSWESGSSYAATSMTLGGDKVEDGVWEGDSPAGPFKKKERGKKGEGEKILLGTTFKRLNKERGSQKDSLRGTGVKGSRKRI